jgi:hypothetical protein
MSADMQHLTPQITGGKKQNEAALVAIRVNLLCYVTYVSTKKKRTSCAYGQFLSSVSLSSYVADQPNVPIGPG